MELAIPILAIGSAFILSNNKNKPQSQSEPPASGYNAWLNKKREASDEISSSPAVANDGDSKKEGYENMGDRRVLPNLNIMPDNYPVQKSFSVGTDINAYNNPNYAMDRYYNDDLAKKLQDQGNQFGDNYTSNGDFVSLSGTKIASSDFNHNNMVPFFGSKMRGFSAGANVYETLFDNKTGSGSQQIRKKERAPLFAPQSQMNNVNGMQNNNDFLQSRMMPSMKISNVKPWEEERVAPGLDKGFNGVAGAGYNSALEAREKWTDRGVDELRVATNPKQTFSLDGHQGPANSFIKEYANTTHVGKFEKNLPDTYFMNTPDRWFTTTGQEKAPTLRAEEIERDVNRTTTSAEYYGVNSNVGGNNTYAPTTYEETKRQEYDGKPMINPYQAQKNPATSGDFGHDSYTMPHNNRTSVRAQEMGGVYGIVRAIVAPVIDALRPSRKENVTGNPRQYGNAESTVPAGTVFNPADRLPTTIKETTLGIGSMDHLNINRQGTAVGSYGNGRTEQVLGSTQRQTTSVEYLGTSGGAATRAGLPLYNAAYNQHHNVNKSYEARTNHGSMSLLGTETNISVAKVESDRNNNRLWVPTNAPSQIPNADMYGQMSMPQSYDMNVNMERINPSILDAFKQNPFTKSLNVY
jgi:hypothetical protein